MLCFCSGSMCGWIRVFFFLCVLLSVLYNDFRLIHCDLHMKPAELSVQLPTCRYACLLTCLSLGMCDFTRSVCISSVTVGLCCARVFVSLHVETVCLFVCTCMSSCLSLCVALGHFRVLLSACVYVRMSVCLSA